MSGLEDAALAFDVAIGNNEAPAEKSGNDDGGSKQRPTESLFGAVGDLEIDEGSPARGGGDDLPVEGEKKPKARREPDPEDYDEEDEQEKERAEDENGPEDDEGDDEGQEPDEDDDDPTKDYVYEVTVDGERIEVSLREALNGYVREKTFHQRMNQLDEIRGAVAREAGQLVADRKKYTELIDDMQKHLDLIIPKEPDWDAEYARDPKAARELQKKFEQYGAIREGLEKEKAEVAKDAEAKDGERWTNYVAAENKKIMSNNPGWKDEKVMARDQGMMADTAQRAGFSLKEVQGMTDSRMVTILLKAAKWDKLQADRPKPIRRGAKPVTPGAGRTRTAPKGGDKAMRQLSRTGSVEDAADVFNQIINPKRR